MQSIRDAYHRYLRYFLSKDDSTATAYDRFMALAYAVRSEMVDRWIRTQDKYHRSNMRRVYYLSTEYILGKSLRQNIISLGLLDDVRRTSADLGFSLEEVFEVEDDLELGNGLKGRESAVMLESMATLGLPGMGYGLRYDYGLFRQKIVNGLQVEVPYDWQNREHPWEIHRPEYRCTVEFGGTSEPDGAAADKRSPHRIFGAQQVTAIPSDIPIPGYLCDTVNTLRLWSSHPSEQFPPEYAHHSDYVKACEDMSEASRVTLVLHPESDIRRATPQRFRMQYFFASTALQDIIRRYKADHGSVEGLEDKVVIHLAGSSCALAVPELMRILVDIERVPWARAWEITRNVFTYASHALSYDNVEIWPVYMFGQILPRHLEIVFEINQDHLDACRAKYGVDVGTIRNLSVIEEGDVKRVRMGHLALLGSHQYAASTAAQRETVAKTAYANMFEILGRPPVVVASGVSHRRWLLGSNEHLSSVITEAIGEAWVRDAMRLAQLEQYATDSAFVDKFSKARRAAKTALASALHTQFGLVIDDSAMFDVQAKRIHPGRRQVLHLLGIVHRYLSLGTSSEPRVPTVHIFGGKAMPSDFLGKQTVALINLVAERINRDPVSEGRLKVVFIPDFGLSWADRVVPAVDLTEELSAPGAEACSTTHLKVAFAGGVPLIRRGGANAEFLTAIGEDTAFAFGADIAPGQTVPAAHTAVSGAIGDVIGWMEQLLMGHAGGETMYPLLSSVRDHDRFGVNTDFESYCEVRDSVDTAFMSAQEWTRRSIRSVARVGVYSADQTALSLARQIWNVESERA